MISQEAKQLDHRDPLNKYRSQFILPENTIYWDGNSLGPLLKRTNSHLTQVIQDEWGEQLIRSWNQKWYALQEQLGNQLGRILGAKNGEIILCDNTSINLYKLACGLLQNNSSKKVLIDSTNFPTDMYLLQGIQSFLDKKIEIDYVNTETFSNTSENIKNKLMSQDYGLMILSHVAFKSGYKYDLLTINRLAKQYGVKVIWDMSHSVGSVDINLHESLTEYAVGCTYKYLNGGPGAPAFIYVKKELIEEINNPIWGWFGHKNPFAFVQDFQSDLSIRKFLVGTPPILSLSALESSLPLFEEVGLTEIRKKSQKMSQYFIEQVEDQLYKFQFKNQSPTNPNERGSHIILSHRSAWQICQALIDKSVGGTAIIPDFRAPNFLRFGIAPLYNQFGEIDQTVHQLKWIIEHQIQNNYPVKRSVIT